MQFKKDHPASAEFALQSGKLIQNFGVVELTTYRWVQRLSGSAIATEISMELPLSKRIDVILRLLSDDTKLGQDQTERAIVLWKEVKKGCELRNAIAHGTVGLLFGEDNELQVAGIMKLRKWKDSNELISIEELRDGVNTTQRIAEELNALLEMPNPRLQSDEASPRR